MLHQSSTEIIGAGSCWLFLLLGWAGWAAAVNNTLPAKAQETYLQNSAARTLYLFPRLSLQLLRSNIGSVAGQSVLVAKTCGARHCCHMLQDMLSHLDGTRGFPMVAYTK
jgi:hypothetical protein